MTFWWDIQLGRSDYSIFRTRTIFFESSTIYLSLVSKRIKRICLKRVTIWSKSRIWILLEKSSKITYFGLIDKGSCLSQLEHLTLVCPTYTNFHASKLSSPLVELWPRSIELKLLFQFIWRFEVLTGLYIGLAVVNNRSK